MRYYIIGTDGNVHGESGDRYAAELMLDVLQDDPELRDLELEIVESN